MHKRRKKFNILVKKTNIKQKRKEAQAQISALEQQAQMMKNNAQMQMQNNSEIENIAMQGNQMIDQAMQNV